MRYLCLISGKQGSGKSSLADALEEILPGVTLRTRFAAILYEIHDLVRDKLREYGVPAPDIDGELLQVLGTEQGRRKYGDDLWVNLTRKRIEAWGEKPSWVILDDARFENEVSMEIEGYKTVRVRLEASEEIRRSRRGSKWRTKTMHVSETALDGWDSWDLRLDTGVMGAGECAARVMELLDLTGGV